MSRIINQELFDQCFLAQGPNKPKAYFRAHKYTKSTITSSHTLNPTKIVETIHIPSNSHKKTYHSPFLYITHVHSTPLSKPHSSLKISLLIEGKKKKLIPCHLNFGKFCLLKIS